MGQQRSGCGMSDNEWWTDFPSACNGGRADDRHIVGQQRGGRRMNYIVKDCGDSSKRRGAAFWRLCAVRTDLLTGLYLIIV